MKAIEDVKMRLKELRESKSEGKKTVHHPLIVIPFINPSHTVIVLFNNNF